MKRIFRLFVLLFAVIVSSAIVCFGAVGQSGNLKSEATVQNELLVPMQIAATTAETIESNQDTFEYTWPSVMAAAEAGNPKAMCLVANHYCWGEGVCDDFRGGKNYKKALEWYRRAAALNHTEAMRKLGDMYSAGKGVIGSDREARKWYEMASKNGDTDAMIALGDSYKYALNKDVAEDRNKALEWYLEAARRGEKKANFSVGLMLHYMSGDGNKEESYIWLARAALGGSSTAQKLLVDNGIHSNQFKEYAARKTRIDDGTYTSASASSATSSKAAATSKANTETASTTPQSLTPQQCYAKGNALYEQRKYDEAIPWLERAAEAKIRSAYMPLAKCYHIEGHSKSNPKKAWTYYAHCVGGDNPHSRDYWYASFMLGQMFTTGYGCEKNYDSALFFLREFRKYTTPENNDTADKLINEVLALQRGGTTQHSTGTSSNARQTTARTTSTNHAASTVGKPAYGQFPQAAYMVSDNNEWIVIKLEFKISNNQLQMHSNLGAFTRLYVCASEDEYCWQFKEAEPILNRDFTVTNVPSRYGHSIVIMKDWSRVGYQGVHAFTKYISKAHYEQTWAKTTKAIQNMAATADAIANGSINVGGSGAVNVQSGMSESYYRNMYDQNARMAESTYNTLTSTGYSISYNDKEKEGGTLGSWSSSNYTQLKRDLRNAQSNMRRIRSEASRAGYQIPQSHWENVSVSY